MDAPEPIADDELLYRRVSESANPRLYEQASGTLSHKAFAPHKTNDETGLSLFRARYKSATELAGGRQTGKPYFVAVLRAGDLRRAGIAVVPQPNVAGGYDPAHAELPDMKSSNYTDDETQERQRILVNLCLRVEGPFETASDQT